MEALTAVQVGLLTIYDMCKAVDRGMVIGDVRLMEKRGGEVGGVGGGVTQSSERRALIERSFFHLASPFNGTRPAHTCSAA